MFFLGGGEWENGVLGTGIRQYTTYIARCERNFHGRPFPFGKGHKGLSERWRIGKKKTRRFHCVAAERSLRPRGRAIPQS